MTQTLVTLVIPARDAATTIDACLEAVQQVRKRPGSQLERVIVVDDGSKDDTLDRVRAYDVDILESGGRGAGAARNIGWRSATTPLVWFVDSDCEPHADALEKLIDHLDSPDVAGVGGTYGIQEGASLLERLIHEEIVSRHARMSSEVDFLATYDVLYRHSVLADLEGFDERYLKGQDAEFAFRVLEAGHRLRFEHSSVVVHHHEQRFMRYLHIQRLQGYWRVALHLEHAGHSSGDSYSSIVDHVQPFLPVLILISLVLLVVPWGWIVPIALFLLLLAMQLPRAVDLMARTGHPSMLAFVLMSAIRAFWRSAGLVQGVLDRLLRRGAIAPQRLGRSTG